jgi:crotonobetainyl-CoA:carnitine CoA-transferase CaiB-like acyl-CoA transferase
MTGKYIHRDRLNSLLLEAFKDREKRELFRSAQELRLLWGEVRNIKEVMNSTHYRDRGFWVDIDHPIAGHLTYSKLPFIMSENTIVNGRAPLLGEHNEEVYCGRLGYSVEDLAKLKETKVI